MGNENTDRTIEGRIRHSIDALAMVIGLTNENPVGKTSIMGIVGDLKLDREDEYLHITFTGREDIVRRLECYIERVNYDGTHEAMMATLTSRRQR